MTIGEWVSLISGIAVTVFGSGGIIAYLNFLSERRKWQEEMALKWAEFNSGKPETEAKALEGAANAVKISAEALEQRFKELEDRANAQQKKIDEQEEHLEFADTKIESLTKTASDQALQIVVQQTEIERLRTVENSQSAQLITMQDRQVSYRRVVHQALETIMDEIGNGHTPDLPKLKKIVRELLAETETPAA